MKLVYGTIYGLSWTVFKFVFLLQCTTAVTQMQWISNNVFFSPTHSIYFYIFHFSPHWVHVSLKFLNIFTLAVYIYFLLLWHNYHTFSDLKQYSFISQIFRYSSMGGLAGISPEALLTELKSECQPGWAVIWSSGKNPCPRLFTLSVEFSYL